MLVAALEHCWKWVELRTNHRVQSVNFYLLAVAFLVTGYFAAFSAKIYFGSAVVAVIGVGVTIGFAVGDIRLLKYVRTGEEAVMELEQRFASALACPQLNMISNVRQGGRRIASSRLVPAYYCASSLAWALAFVGSVIQF